MADRIVVAVTGPSGVGKSLLLRLLAAVTQADVVFPDVLEPHTIELVMTDDARNRVVDQIQRIEAISDNAE